MYTLNFPSGMSQTYPNYQSLADAARAMGGEAKSVSGGNGKIFAFVPKK